MSGDDSDDVRQCRRPAVAVRLVIDKVCNRCMLFVVRFVFVAKKREN